MDSSNNVVVFSFLAIIQNSVCLFFRAQKMCMLNSANSANAAVLFH